jgi:translation initiation factor 2 beta subunit (eIF-2beta)/eIF-5
MNSEESSKQQPTLSEVDPELLEMLNFTMTKEEREKKRERKRKAAEKAAEKGQDCAKVEEEPSYDYHNKLLPKFYEQLYSKVPPASKFVSTPLQPIFTFKNKKTIFQNFDNFINKMQDTNIEFRKQHMIDYMLRELACQGGNITKEGLTFRGIQKKDRCINIIKQYLSDNVKCKCNNFNTVLKKCSSSRLYYIECENCTCTKYLDSYKNSL